MRYKRSEPRSEVSRAHWSNSVVAELPVVGSVSSARPQSAAQWMVHPDIVARPCTAVRWSSVMRAPSTTGTLARKR